VSLGGFSDAGGAHNVQRFLRPSAALIDEVHVSHAAVRAVVAEGGRVGINRFDANVVD